MRARRSSLPRRRWRTASRRWTARPCSRSRRRWPPGHRPRAPRTGLLPGDLAYVIYTSGSTGRPKGVMVQHDHVTRLFSATDAKFHFGPSDVWTLFHSVRVRLLRLGAMGRAALRAAGWWWCRTSSAARRRPSCCLLADEGVTVLNQTPTAFRQLLHSEQQQGEAPALAAALRHLRR
nr:AMP-binding protein [Corallococcus sp. bb12-1]